MHLQNALAESYVALKTKTDTLYDNKVNRTLNMILTDHFLHETAFHIPGRNLTVIL